MRKIKHEIMRDLLWAGYATLTHGGVKYDFDFCDAANCVEVYADGTFVTEFSHREELFDFIDELFEEE